MFELLFPRSLSSGARGTYNARENLRFLGSASLGPLRGQMRQGEIVWLPSCPFDGFFL